MAYEDHPGSLVDERPEIVVYIPEAEERQEAAPTVVEERPLPWIERKEAPWVVVAGAIALIALLALLPTRTIEVSAAPQPGRATTGVDPNAPTWAALAVPVPESLRTHTANVNGSVDVLAVAAPGPGAAQSFVGAVTTADGPMVQQIFGDQAFFISSPTGATLVAFLPYQAGDALIVSPGREVTFVGTLMPVPDDFTAMVGPEAASIGASTGVYVRVVPETLRIVITVPETS
jgi:hypothetical protein